MGGMIERVDLDGKNRMTFSTEKSICALAILHERNEICWRILDLSQISCIGLDGRNERVVFNRITADGDICQYWSNLIVLGERFYWTGNQYVIACILL